MMPRTRRLTSRPLRSPGSLYTQQESSVNPPATLVIVITNPLAVIKHAGCRHQE